MQLVVMWVLRVDVAWLVVHRGSKRQPMGQHGLLRSSVGGTWASRGCVLICATLDPVTKRVSNESVVGVGRGAGIAVMAGLLLALAGCTAPAIHSTHDSPKFEGPWASEFAKDYASADSEFVRGALRDGKISEQEYSEMTTRMNKCLKDDGITFSGFDQSGGYTTKFPQSMGPSRANELTNQCSKTSGESTIGALYHLVQANPNNIDVPSAIAACLVARGVVSAGYTGKDWTREAPAGKYSFIVDEATGQAAVVDCNRDPFSKVTG